MDNLAKYAVIVAGGRGQRMGNAIPKQFLPLAGKPLLHYCIRAFRQAFSDIQLILVLPPEHISYSQIVLQSFEGPVEMTIIAGGETRFHSVQNGLKAVTNGSVVFVHDGARPLLTTDLIHRCYRQALEKGSAIPAIPVTDSIRQADGIYSCPVNRDHLKSIQTPQTFRAEILLPAFKQPYNTVFTDEATVVEAAGTKILLTEGEKSNIKITAPEDMVIAEALLKHQLQHA